MTKDKAEKPKNGTTKFKAKPSLKQSTKPEVVKTTKVQLKKIAAPHIKIRVNPKEFKAGYVALLGRPNVGKSTLLNKLIGQELSIVSSKAQTTRDSVLGILTEPAKGQIVFVDTPGVHRAKQGGVNEHMMSRTKEAIEEPDLIWYLIDPESAEKHESEVLELLKTVNVPVFFVINKMDLVKTDTVAWIDEWLKTCLTHVKRLDVRPFFISAKKAKNLDHLLKATFDLLPFGMPFFPDLEQVSDRPMRYFVGEKIREQIFHSLGEELPYCCAVEIESFSEGKTKTLAGDTLGARIQAKIHVERDSQKGMVVGAQGKKVKEIGQGARERIEKMLGTKVFLGLKVVVTKDWSRDPKALERLGYIIPQKRGK